MKDILYYLRYQLGRGISAIRKTDFPTVVLLMAVSILLYLTEILFGADYSRWCFKSPLVHEAWATLPSSIGLFVEQNFKLFPPLFLHGGPEHLVGNMLMLWPFGCLVAQHLGRLWTVVIYLITGAIGNLLHVYLEPQIGAIGASGAICGLEGIYFVLAIRWALGWPSVFPLAHPVPPRNLAIFAAIGIAFDVYGVASRTNAGIAYGGHIGGFFAGVAIALAITQFFKSPEIWRRSGWYW